VYHSLFTLSLSFSLSLSSLPLSLSLSLPLALYLSPSISLYTHIISQKGENATDIPSPPYSSAPLTQFIFSPGSLKGQPTVLNDTNEFETEVSGHTVRAPHW
jgi:hypothetical protein